MRKREGSGAAEDVWDGAFVYGTRVIKMCFEHCKDPTSKYSLVFHISK